RRAGAKRAAPVSMRGPFALQSPRKGFDQGNLQETSETQTGKETMTRPAGQLRLGAFFNPTGHHVASWRHPDAQADAGINFRHFAEIAQTAERGKFDMVFLADANCVRDARMEALSRSAQYIA